MVSPNWRTDMLDDLKRIVREAGTLLFPLQGKSLGQITADERGQTLIIDELRKLEDIPVVAEEGDGHKTTADRFWCVDPLDGTALFDNGADRWAISIARIENGSPTMGVIYFPVIGKIISTERGRGTKLNGKMVYTSQSVPILKRVLCGLDLYEGVGDEEWHHTVKPLLSIFRVPLNEPACATVLSLLEGITVAAYTNDWKIWDGAAGILALEEAQGCARTRHGNSLVFWESIALEPLLLASNHEIWQQVSSKLPPA